MKGRLACLWINPTLGPSVSGLLCALDTQLTCHSSFEGIPPPDTGKRWPCQRSFQTNNFSEPARQHGWGFDKVRAAGLRLLCSACRRLERSHTAAVRRRSQVRPGVVLASTRDTSVSYKRGYKRSAMRFQLDYSLAEAAAPSPNSRPRSTADLCAWTMHSTAGSSRGGGTPLFLTGGNACQSRMVHGNYQIFACSCPGSAAACPA